MSGPASGGAPSREVRIDDDLVRAVLTAGAPDLLDLPRAIVAEGWDNVLVRLGDELVLRLPRRGQAAALIEHEQLWLPVLGPLLPVATPVPVRSGGPVPGFPWRWSVLRWREGVVAGARPRSRASTWAPDLARSFAALHHPAPGGAPHNPVRAVPLASRDEVVRARLGRIGDAGHDADALTAIWDRGLAAPAWTSPPVWVHGDPHPNNLLVRPGVADGPDRLDSLLDWGDLSAGDPACDLAAGWLAFDAEGRAAFRRTYEELSAASAPDPGRWERAAAWAVAMASSVVVDAPGDSANRAWADPALREASGSLG